jgi:hypothetical protein
MRHVFNNSVIEFSHYGKSKLFYRDLVRHQFIMCMHVFMLFISNNKKYAETSTYSAYYPLHLALACGTDNF